MMKSKPPFAAARRPLAWLAALACVTGVAGVLTGCLNLRPRVDPARHFVLATLPPTVDPAPGAVARLSVGLGPVGLPGYLSRSSLAIRTSPHEIRYDDQRQWAEPLQAGIPRVLAINLGPLLGPGQVRTAAWRRGEVACELHLTVEQFDVDEAGRGTLVARWRITNPGAEQVLGRGQTALTREGPAPGGDPGGAVGTLSDLLGELSRQLAGELVATPLPPAR